MRSAANATLTETKAASPPAPAAPGRRGGLIAMPKGVMSPVFALLVAFLALDVLILVAPYYVCRFTDDLWGSAERMEFLAKAMASALAFGFVASVAAERRNYSPWAFLLGHCGFFVALAFAAAGWDLDHGRTAPLLAVAAGFVGCVIVVARTAKPRPAPPPVRGVLLFLCRLTGACGNIWFGIALMASIAAIVGAGTIIETRYTGRAAQFLVYRAPWFGAIFFTAGLSMLSATFRKYPFRLEQAGWLTVHTGLALVVIGSMTSFLTKVEGEVQIKEGQQVDSFQLSARTRLEVVEAMTGTDGKPRATQVLEALSDFDLNPAEKEPARTYQAAGSPLSLTVDRYFANGVRSMTWHDDGAEPHAGVAFDLFVGDDILKDAMRLDEAFDNETQLPMRVMSFPVALRRALRGQLDAMARTEDPKDHGRIVVSDEAGRRLAEIPVSPGGADSRPAGRPAPLTGSAAIPGTGIEVKLSSYADNVVRSDTGGVFDETPGNPINPAVALTLVGPKGEDARLAHAYVDDDFPTPGAPGAVGRYPYRVTYEAAPRIQLDGPLLMLVAVGDRMSFVYVSRDGTRTAGPVKEGEPLALPMPMVRLVPKQVATHLRIDEYTFENYEPEHQVIRVTPAWNGVPEEPLWIRLGEQKAFVHDDRQFAVRWKTTSRPLGFTLRLNDFHRDFRPGSLQPATFESYLRLVHPAKFPQGEDIKIDMNHPLRLDGWRLFQSRFDSGEAERPGETTILEVNRDPGLAIVYPACAAVLLGLIVVMFMKKTLALLRKKLERERARPEKHLLLAIASVAAVGIGPAIFATYVAIRPWCEHQFGILLPLSGWPAFVFGLSLVALFPIMVVSWFSIGLHKRLEASLAGRRQGGPS